MRFAFKCNMYILGAEERGGGQRNDRIFCCCFPIVVPNKMNLTAMQLRLKITIQHNTVRLWIISAKSSGRPSFSRHVRYHTWLFITVIIQRTYWQSLLPRVGFFVCFYNVCRNRVFRQFAKQKYDKIMTKQRNGRASNPFGPTAHNF